MRAHAVGCCAIALLWTLNAQAATPFAAPVAQPLPSPAGGLARVTIALIVVLAAVLAAGWFARRMRSFGGPRAAQLQVLGQVALGARERAVLVRVGERDLLLGVAPGNVRTLLVFDGVAPNLTAPPMDGPAEAQRPTFKSVLLRSLGK